MKRLKMLYALILSIIVCFFIGCLFLYPKEVIAVSKDGILLWFNSVFPAIFTFIIGANLLIGLGFSNFIGTILEPVMRPLFNVPGVGAFAAVMGITSGYPVGAKLAVDLRQKKMLTKEEAMRLISFCNNSGPLFLFGAIGVGIYNSTSVGVFFMTIHYLAAFSTGLLFRFYKADRSSGYFRRDLGNIIKKAIYNQRVSYKKDGRKFGVLLGDSIKNAMEIAIQIGGFIVSFSVIIEILRLSGISEIFISIIKPIFSFLGFDKNICEGLFVGIIELTNGTKVISKSTAPIIEKIAITNMIIAFSSLSIHAQTIAIISKSDIKTSFYILSKAVHSFFALGYSLLLYPLIQNHIYNAVFVNAGFNVSPINSFFSSLIYFFVFCIAFSLLVCFVKPLKTRFR